MSGSKTDIFYQAASVWNELTEYKYLFTYGYKHKLYEISLTFSPGDFPHLAGFQYLKDVSLPRYNPEKIVSRILDGTITLDQIQKAAEYEEMIVPRLEALVRMKDALDNDFILFSYMPCMYPFYTQIKADYLISYHSDVTNFIFIVQANADGTAKFDYLCCSAFKQGDRDYETNQRSRALLKKNAYISVQRHLQYYWTNFQLSANLIDMYNNCFPSIAAHFIILDHCNQPIFSFT